MTPRQQEAVDALAKHGSRTAAAKAMGVDRKTFRGLIERAQLQAVTLHREDGEVQRVKIGASSRYAGPNVVGDTFRTPSECHETHDETSG